MAMIIGVRFREVGRVYYFDPGEHVVKRGDRVIVETARGVECGEVVQENTDVPEEQVKRPLKLMIRKATAEDLANVESKVVKEAEAFKICEEKIRKHGLDMSLVNVEYTFDASKIIFYFTADQRVDFRALVRDLAGVFRTRIELRQIGVRDEAKLLGGLGVCGRPFCCSLFMGDFHPVSIKMAKEQGLSLNPTKISGTCGRLMCCLKYEEAAYEAALKLLPKVGSSVETPDGRGVVTEVNAVSQAIKVKLERRSDAAPVTFQFSAEEGVQRKPATLRENSLLGPLTPSMEDSFSSTSSNGNSGSSAETPPSQPRRQRQDQQKQKSRGQGGRQKQGQNRGGHSPGASNAEARSRAASAEGKGRTDSKPRAAEPKAPAGAAGSAEKNWRERHNPRKKEAPVYREEPRRAQSPQQPRQQSPSQPQRQQAPSQPQRQQPPSQPSGQHSPSQQPRQQSPRPQSQRQGQGKSPQPSQPQPHPSQPPQSVSNSVDTRRAEGAPRRATAPKPADPQGGTGYRKPPWQKRRGAKADKPKKP